MSATGLLEPLIILHLNPGTVMALGATVVSAASFAAAAIMGGWFTRIEREARAKDASDLLSAIHRDITVRPLDGEDLVSTT